MKTHTKEDNNTQPEPKPVAERVDRKPIMCFYCGHRTAIRRWNIETKEDTYWRCENCKRKTRR